MKPHIFRQHGCWCIARDNIIRVRAQSVARACELFKTFFL